MGLRTAGLRVAAIGVTLCAGCNEFQAAVEEAVADSDAPAIVPPPPDATDPSQADPTPQQQLARKVARYAECLHRTAPLVVASAAAWHSTVSEAGTPASRRTTATIKVVSDVRGTCEAVDQQGPSLVPPLPKLEGAAATYVDALRQVALHSKTLNTYYTDAAHADDDWALGKSLAPTMQSAFGRFEQAALALSTVIDTQADEADRALLAEAGDKTVRWHAHATMLSARSWVRCILPPLALGRAEPAAPVESETCDATMSAYVAATNGLIARRSAHPDEASAVFWLTSFTHSAQQLRALAEAVHAAPTPPASGKKRKPKKKTKKKEEAAPPRSGIQPAFDALVLDYGQLGL